MRPVRFRRGGLHNLRDLHIDKNQVQRSPPRRPLLELMNIRLVECFAASQKLEGRGSRQDALFCLEHQIGPGTADARRAKRCTSRLRLAKGTSMLHSFPLLFVSMFPKTKQYRT